MRMICIVNNTHVTCAQPRVVIQKIMSKVFFIPSFIDKQELRILCRDEQGASRLWKSYMQSGNLIFKDCSYDEAFTEIGSALQIAHYQLTITNTPTWRWAMRLVESTNLTVVILGQLGHESVIGELLVAVEQQILALPNLKDCPPKRDARWLCRWCKSMSCKRRRERLANLYLQNKAFADSTQAH